MPWVTLDGAGWHQQGGMLRVPGNISLLPLPPYSPKLNSQENVWQFLRQNYLANRVFDSHVALIDACCEAWNDLVAMPDRIKTTATRDWTQAGNALGRWYYTRPCNELSVGVAHR